MCVLLSRRLDELDEREQPRQAASLIRDRKVRVADAFAL